MKSPIPRRKIRFHQGRWWLIDPDGDSDLRICGIIEDSGWNVADLCARLRTSRRTFDRIIEEGLGIPAKRWLRELRVVRARHRLREGASIKEVAAELGFRHATDFTREFKKLVGVTPSAYQTAERDRSSLGSGVHD